MARIVECVPNFSEGQHKEVIEAIATAIAATEGCSLLDVDPGVSTNRTVYTFVGSPEHVVHGALAAARAASQLIDMTHHSGEHPRMGALDVCPFIPVKNVTMEDCVKCAKIFGSMLAEDLGVPVYLYGEAASKDERKLLPNVRAGEYEALQEKLTKPEWAPDFGPSEFIPNWGATATGARKFLIAYNVNVLSTKEQAHRIALNIRENGRGADQPGRLKNVQGIGWYLDESNIAQVSTNITDYEITPIHTVYEECCKDAQELNLAVVGSQIVGLVPLQCILQAADYYMTKDNLFLLEEDQKVRLVVSKLGLGSLGGFNPKERIIEYMLDDETTGPLASLGVRDFVMTVGARSPSPGGGSVSALIAALGTSLGTMVGFLTYGKKQFAALDSKMRELLPPLYQTTKDLIPKIDDDAAAFNKYMAALKLPKTSDEEKKLQEAAIQEGIQTAIAVPMSTATSANDIWPAMIEMAKVGNINCKSDLQVGARCVETGVWGAYYNVMTNIADLSDQEYKTRVETEINAELKKAQEGCAEVLKILAERK
ncbi:unnamed protein product [Owenia fusiformis]|uniref:Formimidoyltransferase-cyclodeaminase n=1 Tax=Owenia fusiformis TaxID=6347 RepID=A0A8J1Y560_OWEFU|nr:unnamed protein product [Owenia fusiformis]